MPLVFEEINKKPRKKTAKITLKPVPPIPKIVGLTPSVAEKIREEHPIEDYSEGIKLLEKVLPTLTGLTTGASLGTARLIPGYKKTEEYLKKESPTAYTIGEIGSFLVPGGAIKAPVKLSQLATKIASKLPSKLAKEATLSKLPIGIPSAIFEMASKELPEIGKKIIGKIPKKELHPKGEFLVSISKTGKPTLTTKIPSFLEMMKESSGVPATVGKIAKTVLPPAVAITAIEEPKRITEKGLGETLTEPERLLGYGIGGAVAGTLGSAVNKWARSKTLKDLGIKAKDEAEGITPEVFKKHGLSLNSMENAYKEANNKISRLNEGLENTLNDVSFVQKITDKDMGSTVLFPAWENTMSSINNDISKGLQFGKTTAIKRGLENMESQVNDFISASYNKNEPVTISQINKVKQSLYKIPKWGVMGEENPKGYIARKFASEIRKETLRELEKHDKKIAESVDLYNKNMEELIPIRDFIEKKTSKALAPKFATLLGGAGLAGAAYQLQPSGQGQDRAMWPSLLLAGAGAIPTVTSRFLPEYVGKPVVKATGAKTKSIIKAIKKYLPQEEQEPKKNITPKQIEELLLNKGGEKYQLLTPLSGG